MRRRNIEVQNGKYCHNVTDRITCIIYDVEFSTKKNIGVKPIQLI